VPRSKRLRDIGSTVSAVTSSREGAAAPSVDLSRYMIKETFDELFEKVNLGTAEVPHWAIKAKLNLFTVGWLSFNGSQIGDGSAGDTPVAGAQNLADLKDVSLGNILPGQVLSWNGNKWVNSTLATSGFDELQLSQYLTSHNYAHKSDIPSLAGYATESWVLQKLQSIGADDLFEKVNLGTELAPVWAIKAKYNLYTVGWLSFRGPQVGGGGDDTPATIASNLADLKDVSLGSLAAGQALVWNGAKWVNSTIATSGLDESSLSNYLSSHGYATQAWANGAFVNKAGDTMTGHLTMLAKDVYLKNGTDNSQCVCYGFKNTANAIIAQIGYHNTAKRIIINPVGSSEPWVDAVGKYNLIVGNNELKYNTYSLLHTGNYASTLDDRYVKKSGDTMSGTLKVNDVSAVDGNLLLAYAPPSLTGVTSSQWAVGVVNLQGVIRSGNASLVHYRHGAGNATIWDSLNDGSGSGLDADLLDGVHNGDVTARLVNYNNGGNVSGAVQFMQKYNGWNAWDAPTQNWHSVIKLNHGNGDTYYSRVLAFDFHSDNIYTHRKHNGTDYGWHTLAFIDSTVANANSLGGKAAAQYVTTDTAQTITGAKSFNGTLTINTQTILTRAAISMGTSIGDATYDKYHRIDFGFHSYDRINIYEQAVNFFTNGGTTAHTVITNTGLTAPKLIKSGGTASQFLKADGSVDGTSYATASALSTGLAGKVSKSGDTMSGDLWFGAPDKGVKFSHAGVNGIWGHTSDNAATNQIGSTALSNLVIASHWGVAFTSTCSNQTYTDKVAVGIDTRIGSVAAGSWVKASHFLANTTTLCTNLNADLLDGLHLDSVRGYRVEHPAINSSLAVGNVPFNAFGMQHGTPLYIDPEFASGTNNVSVYNNLHNGNVTVTRIADNQASANSSGYILQIKVTGAAEPWTGGFVQSIQSRANAVFMQIFRAKIPVGYNVNANSNSMGDNYSDVWITSTAGTGKWEWYARVVYCGASGSFSYGGYVSLKGANATAANPLYWYLSHCQTWDLSKNNYGSLRAKFADALSASRTLWGQSFNGSNNVSGDMTGVGTITSTYYSLHNISNNPYLKFNVGGNITYVQALSTGIGVGPTHTGLFVTNDSKVGIGTASPSEKLSIAGWVGTIGATGWYNITYQGGWHMADSTWIRTYNNKNVYAGSAIIRTDGTIQVGDGGSKFYANSSGVVFAATGIWTNGYMSFRGQNTSSDARQKRIIRDIHVPLTTIAKAPNVVFSWLDSGKLDMGSIAQYWHKHLPLSVYVRDNGYLGMDYSKVALACVISMASELLGVKDDVSVLKQEVRQLRHENRELKQQIDKMGRRIA